MGNGATTQPSKAAPVVDAFALFGEPRRLWPDPDALKERFLQLSGETHPDRFHHLPEPEREAAGQRFEALNTAYQLLRETKPRLQHLLQLESGVKPREVQSFPDELMGVFGEVSTLCRQADAFLVEKERAASPLLKVKLFEQGMEWTDKLTALQARLQTRQAALDAELKTLNHAWETAPPVGAPERPRSLPLVRLEELYRDASYLARWSAQVRERIVQLSL